MAKEQFSRSQIHQTISFLNLDKKQALLLLNKVFPPPGVAEWRNFFKSITIVLGCGFFLTGVIFFFAYNWFTMHRFVKMSIAGTLLLLPCMLQNRIRYSERLQKILYVYVFIMVGVIMALFGQVYQTGANAYDLFLYWSIFTIPVAFFSMTPLLWLLWILVFNLAVFSFGGQVLGGWINQYLYFSIAIFNGGALIGFELASYNRKIKGNKWFGFLLLLLLYAWLITGAGESIFREFKGIEYVLMISLTLLSLTLAFLFYMRLKSISNIALSFLAVIILVMCGYFKLFNLGGFWVFLFSAVLLLVLIESSILHLLKLRDTWQLEGGKNE